MMARAHPSFALRPFLIEDTPLLAEIFRASISELTKLSDHCLYYSSNSPSYTRSHAALLSLIQALAYAVYSNDEAAYEERIKAYKLK